jgi:RNA 3'-phosphate cyclase
MLHIDGSYMEGGGQIVRTALALSILTQKPFRAENIRHNRPKPGLKNQHLSCINALEQLADAQTEGARLGSEVIEFIPAKIKPGILSLDIGTAGSITLLLQSLLLPCIFADGEVKLVIQGGTDTKWSIPIDYFTNVILPFFEEFALIRIQKMRRGYYPRGQGIVEMLIKPHAGAHEAGNIDALTTRARNQVPAIHLTAKPRLLAIKGISSASRELKHAEVAHRQAHGATRKIGNLYPVEIAEEYRATASVGTVITLWANFEQDKATIGATALGKKGVPAETIGKSAATRLLHFLNTGAAVDKHLADNIIPLLALVGGTIKTTEITGHILANVYVCKKFLNLSFKIDQQKRQISVG